MPWKYNRLLKQKNSNPSVGVSPKTKKVRKRNGIDSIKAAVGYTIHGVFLEGGEMTTGSVPSCRLWDRIFLSARGCWIEVWNVEEANRYAFHSVTPESVAPLKCI